MHIYICYIFQTDKHTEMLDHGDNNLSIVLDDP